MVARYHSVSCFRKFISYLSGHSRSFLDLKSSFTFALLFFAYIWKTRSFLPRLYYKIVGFELGVFCMLHNNFGVICIDVLSLKD